MDTHCTRVSREKDYVELCFVFEGGDGSVVGNFT